MTKRLNQIALAVVLVSMASHAAAQTPAPLRLKGRSFVPPRNVHALGAGRPLPLAGLDAPGGRHHLIVQFDGPVTRGDLRALRAAGAVPLRYVPENALAISAPPGFSFETLRRVRWAGALAPADKLSSESLADLARANRRYPLTVVTFQPDVTREELNERLARAGTAAVPRASLPSHVAVIPTDRAAVERLAGDSAVAWIYPATTDALAEGSIMCAGLVTPQGLVAEYATLGEGWDGPGRGAAALGFHQVNSSSGVSQAASSVEVRRALEEWSRHIAVTWRPALGTSDPSSLTIFWAVGEHGDGHPFAPEVLAHAFYQAPLTPEPLAGDVHFNDAFDWGVSDPSRYDIFSVMLHEAGHSLGLTHSADPEGVMYPMYGGIVTGLAPSDVASALQLYASTTPAAPAGWSDDTVGSSVAGLSEASDGLFRIEASGRDVWGTADELRFLHRPLVGDGDLVARVDALAGPHRWSKAGVMIRASTAASAQHAFMLVSTEKGIAFQRRRAAGGSTVSTAEQPGTAPAWLWLSRRGDRFQAYAASDGGAWTLIGSDTIPMGQTVLAGLALTSHDATRTATATFSGVSVTGPLNWNTADIGAVDRTGSLTVSSLTRLQVAGAGADIWGTADAFRFAWRPLTGDGEILAHVTSLQATDRWSKAGVMIRDGLSPGAAHAFMLVSPEKGYAFQRRPVAGGISYHTAAGSGTAPQWVRLRRRGNVITAYRSSDGAAWTEVGSESIAMGSTVLVGVAVSSHRAGATCLALFDGVSLR